MILATSNLSCSGSEIGDEDWVNNIKQEVALDSITEHKDESDTKEVKKGKIELLMEF